MKTRLLFEVFLISCGWYLTSFVTDTLNKRVQGALSLPVTLTLLQFLTGATVNFVAIYVLRLIPFQRATKEHFRMLTAISLCWTFGFLLTNYSFGRVAVSFTHSVKATGTRSVLSKTLFSKGAFANPLDNFNLFMYISLASFLLLLPVWAVAEAPALYNRGFKAEDSDIYSMALLNGFTHCMYNQFSFMILTRLSTMAHSIINASRRFFVIFLTVVAFGHPFNRWNFLGTFLLLVGVVMYARSKGMMSKSTSNTSTHSSEVKAKKNFPPRKSS